MTRPIRGLLAMAPLAAAACAADLAHGEAGPDAGRSDGYITTLDSDGEVATTVVDATRDAEWVYFDLESGSEVPLDADDAHWDLGFQRFKIKVNGGDSGSGGVEVAPLDKEDFDELTTAPQTGYITDEPDSDDDEDDETDRAFEQGNGWYAYDESDHTLSPHEVVYVVRSVEEAYFKLEILDYYDDAGTSGFMTFRWAPIDAP